MSPEKASVLYELKCQTLLKCCYVVGWHYVITANGMSIHSSFWCECKTTQLDSLMHAVNVIMLQIIATVMIRWNNSLPCDYTELILKRSFHWIPMQHCNWHLFTSFFPLHVWRLLSLCDHLHSSLLDGVILQSLPPKRCLTQCIELNVIIIMHVWTRLMLKFIWIALAVRISSNRIWSWRKDIMHR